MVIIMTVARTGIGGKLTFLAAHTKRTRWTADQRSAESFRDLREATRAALQLPGKFRAYALPIASDGDGNQMPAAR